MAYRRTTRIQTRIDAQRAAVVRAAAEILAESGYAGCTITAVAARAGIASGSVYTHFRNKAELAAEVFRSIVTREIEAVRAVAQSGSAVERIVAVLETFAGRAAKSPRRAFALLAEPVDPAVEQLRLEFRRTFRDVLSAAIDHGIGSGELPPQDSTVAAAALVGAFAEALTGPLIDGTAGPDVVPDLAQFAVRAVGGEIHADS